ncbi:MAG: DUF1616 domain-containing protein [Patescibacteria group bacterium]
MEILILIYILYLFLPGFILSLILFEKNTLDPFERIIFSYAFSLTILPCIAFYANLLGIPITAKSVSLQVLIITLVFISIFIIQKGGKTHEKT